MARRLCTAGLFAKRATEPVKQFSRNPKFDLYNTAWLPAYDPSGEHLAVTKMKPAKRPACSSWMRTNLLVPILEQPGLILAPAWSPDGKQIVVGVGIFTAFLDFTAGG